MCNHDEEPDAMHASNSGHEGFHDTFCSKIKAEQSSPDTTFLLHTTTLHIHRLVETCSQNRKQLSETYLPVSGQTGISGQRAPRFLDKPEFLDNGYHPRLLALPPGLPALPACNVDPPPR